MFQLWLIFAPFASLREITLLRLEFEPQSDLPLTSRKNLSE